MKIAEILRKMADIIDRAEQPDSVPANYSPLSKGDDINRFKQIAGIVPTCDSRAVMNEPKEEYASIEAVTTDAGGGVNGPKHPHDIRVKDPSAYPNQQRY
jgi:hypothetical protein